MHPFPGGYPKFVNGVQGVILTCAIWRWKFSDCFSAYVRPLSCLKGKHHNMHIFSGMQSYMHVYIYIYTYCNKKSWVWKSPLFSRFFIPKSKKQGTSCGSGTAAKKETQETANLSPREKCRSHLDGFVRSTSFKALPDVTCFVDSHSRMKNQPRVWGRVVWIAGIPENEMDCYLRKSESQANN